MTSVFKSTIDDGDKSRLLLNLDLALRLITEKETVIVYRSIKTEDKDNHLITVCYGTYDKITNPETVSKDFYVNNPNSATSEKEFYVFLEEFLYLELPLIRSSDGSKRKLYLRVIFSSVFVEQKHR